MESCVRWARRSALRPLLDERPVSWLSRRSVAERRPKDLGDREGDAVKDRIVSKALGQEATGVCDWPSHDCRSYLAGTPSTTAVSFAGGLPSLIQLVPGSGGLPD
jgi:hypothetical protein